MQGSQQIPKIIWQTFYEPIEKLHPVVREQHQKIKDINQDMSSDFVLPASWESTKKTFVKLICFENIFQNKYQSRTINVNQRKSTLIMASMKTMNQRNIKQNSVPTKTPYCGFCFNLGKPPAVYNSHFIRETPAKDSRIVCPELKCCTCVGCGKQGHTISNCLALKNERRMGDNIRDGLDAPYKNRYDQTSKKIREIKPKNIFSLLSDDDDEEFDDETVSMHSDDTTIDTSITSSVVSENDASMKSYAAALMSVLHPKRTAIVNVVEQPRVITQTYDISVFKNVKRYTSWADYDSSDDEE